jgi:hypothetical protein
MLKVVTFAISFSRNRFTSFLRKIVLLLVLMLMKGYVIVQIELDIYFLKGRLILWSLKGPGVDFSMLNTFMSLVGKMVNLNDLIFVIYRLHNVGSPF